MDDNRTIEQTPQGPGQSVDAPPPGGQPSPATPVQGPSPVGAPTPVAGQATAVGNEALQRQVAELEKRLRGLQSSADRRVYEMQQQYQQQLSQAMAERDQVVTSQMTDDQRVQYENQRLRQMLEQQSVALAQMQAVQRAAQYRDQLTSFYLDKGVPMDVISANLESPQQLQEAVIDYFAQRGTAPQQPPPQPVQPAPQQPQQWTPPQQPQPRPVPQPNVVTSHVVQEPPGYGDAADKLQALAEQTRGKKEDTIFEALGVLEGLEKGTRGQ